MENYKVVKRIIKNGTSLAVNIPVEIVELLNLKEKDMIEIDIKKIK